MAAPPLLLLQDIALTFGGHELLDSVDLSVGPGERLALVGRNGSGKSTLMRIAAGLIEPDRGRRFVQPGTTLRYLAQEPDFGGAESVLAYVQAGLGPADDGHRALRLLEGLGLTGAEHPGHLSGGEARRAALARALAPEPDILLLDEPTNHLDLPVIEWLEGELAATSSALVLISHDRRFLENLSQACVWIDRGRSRRLEAGFGRFEAWRDEILEQEEQAAHLLDRKLVREADWLRHGVSGRRKRNMGRLRALQALRTEKRERRRVVGKADLQASEAEMSGKKVIEAKRIAKAFDGRPIVRDLSLVVQRGDRLGLVGPNGAGKTTLLRMLTGQLEPDDGTVRLGSSLDMVTLEQSRSSLAPDQTLQDALTGGGGDTVQVNGKPRHVRSYMQDFLFDASQARTPLRVLSGGERARVMLARALAQPSNLLVLDEPTNDLDLETLDLLQELIADYPGTVVLVSHDRDFLDRTVDSTLAFEGDGRWIEYAGGYSDMLAQRRDATPAAQPVRKAAAQPPAPVPAPPRERKRLSFKDKHALETLPRRMEQFQAEIERLKQELADPGLFRRDAARFQKASTDLAARETALMEAEEEWLRLEMLREELEQGQAP
ncbi:ABC-F family ATP-binding cassette domain-containing protein [Zavarzinia sp. CC-PAN008]|uniref:ABC-F family ATP-binding cassette domain-containing protein n=1 Tax=Zavarzinia sp. CC-PAN008 TaxID=3243332 RepID=UPI003F747065